MKSAVSLGIAATILALTFIAASCDRATDPRTPAPREWDVLVRGIDLTDRYFVFNTGARSVVDSFVLPFSVGRPELNAAGDIIYFAGFDSIVYMDFETRTLLGSMPYNTQPYTSPAGDFLAIVDEFGVSYVVRTPEHTLYATIDFAVKSISFSPNGKRLYTHSVDRYIRSYLLADTLVLTDSLYDSLGFPFRLAGNSAGDEVYVYSRVFSPYYSVHVYELPSGTLLFDSLFSSGAGGLALDPTEKYLYFTNSGSVLYPSFDQAVRVYDIANRRIVKTIETSGFVPGYGNVNRVGPIVVTPDSRWLIGVSGNFAGNAITLINLTTRELDTIITVGAPGFLFENITMARR